MRICLITLDFPPTRTSGLTVYAEKVAAGLAERGHDVTVVAARRPMLINAANVMLPDNVAVVRVNVGRTEWLGLGWQAATYLRHSGGFDVVHFVDVHFAYAYGGTFVASAFQSFRQRLTSHRGRPYHTHWRNYLFRLGYYSVARWTLERLAVRRACHIIASSEATRQEFIEHYGVEAERITRVYLGVNFDRFGKLPRRYEARRRLGLPIDAPLLLYVGFSTPRKGVEYLAQAMRSVGRSVHLVMVGSWENHYREKFLRSLGEASSRVHITGYVPDEELLYYYAAADVFVLPTLLEGFGIPLIEAMAAGLPVVTTTAGSAGEVVDGAGLCVPPHDSEALAAAIERIVHDPALAQRLAERGQTRVRAVFSERRCIDEIEAIYQQYVVRECQ